VTVGASRSVPGAAVEVIWVWRKLDEVKKLMYDNVCEEARKSVG